MLAYKVFVLEFNLFGNRIDLGSDSKLIVIENANLTNILVLEINFLPSRVGCAHRRGEADGFGKDVEGDQAAVDRVPARRR